MGFEDEARFSFEPERKINPAERIVQEFKKEPSDSSSIQSGDIFVQPPLLLPDPSPVPLDTSFVRKRRFAKRDDNISNETPRIPKIDLFKTAKSNQLIHGKSGYILLLHVN